MFRKLFLGACSGSPLGAYFESLMWEISKLTAKKQSSGQYGEADPNQDGSSTAEYGNDNQLFDYDQDGGSHNGDDVHGHGQPNGAYADPHNDHGPPGGARNYYDYEQQHDQGERDDDEMW